MGAPLAVDLEHLGLPGAVSTFVLTHGEPAVVDPGPSTTLDALERGLSAHGLGVRDLRHVLLTHVHLDHAGAAGHLVGRVPGLLVHVHADGAVHMADPARLVASTRRTFGEAHDRLWGDVLPVPRDRIRPWEPGGRGPLPGLRAFPTPGHVAHHLAYLDERSGTLFAGDSMGIVLAPDAPTHPPTPPPGVDLEAWAGTLERLEALGPERMGVAHFGLHEDVGARRRELAERLVAVERRVREALAPGGAGERDALAYEEEVRSALAAHLPREHVDRYFDVFTAATDWAGVRRYVEKNPPGT